MLAGMGFQSISSFQFLSTSEFPKSSPIPGCTAAAVLTSVENKTQHRVANKVFTASSRYQERARREALQGGAAIDTAKKWCKQFTSVYFCLSSSSSAPWSNWSFACLIPGVSFLEGRAAAHQHTLNAPRKQALQYLPIHPHEILATRCARALWSSPKKPSSIRVLCPWPSTSYILWHWVNVLFPFYFFSLFLFLLLPWPLISWWNKPGILHIPVKIKLSLFKMK